MAGDLPDYEKKVVVVTIPGDYPAEMKIDHRKILGESLKTPTFALSIPTSIENDALAYEAVNDRFKVVLEAITAGVIPVSLSTLLNPHPVSLASIPNPPNLDVALSTRATGTLLNPHPVSLSTLLNPHPVSLSTLLNPHPVSLSTLLNPHPVSLTSIPNPSNLDVALSTRATGTLLNPHPVSLSTLLNPHPVSLTSTTISSVDATATPYQISLTALNGNSAAIVTPASGKKVRLKFVSLEQSAAVDLGYRFGAAGTIFYLRTTAGVYVSNLIGCNNQGAADEALYLNSSGATNVKGYILVTEV